MNSFLSVNEGKDDNRESVSESNASTDRYRASSTSVTRHHLDDLLVRGPRDRRDIDKRETSRHNEW